jgi:hypothetical protein
MRRFLLGLAIGFGLGWALAQRASRTQEPLDLREEPSSVLGAMARHPSARRLGRVVDLTSERGLRAIRRARAGIQRRLVADVDDVSMN